MLLDRGRPIQQRLILAFGLFSALLLLAIWLIDLAYLYSNGRKETLRTLQTQVAVLASQSTAAVVFGDRVALEENLAALQHMDNLKWAVVVAVPEDAPVQERLLAQFGAPPAAPDRYFDELSRHEGVLVGLNETVVRQDIVHNGSVRGQVAVAVDQHSNTSEFLHLVLVSLLLNLAFLAVAMVVFHHIVTTVTRPMQQLTSIAETASAAGIPLERADSQFDDEVGRLSKSFNLMLDNLAARETDLARSRDELRALSLRLQQIREEERTHIAHEIHDELGQRMTALKFALARLDDETNRRELGTAIDATIQVVRDLSWSLRPSVLDSVGLDAALEWLARDFQQRIGIRCKVRLPERTPDLHPDQATDVFRICQELLTNVARHAHATRVDIVFAAGADGLSLEVRDNGIGMQPRGSGRRSLGLLGIEERARRWQGRVAVATRPAVEGTVTRVDMPPCAPESLEKPT